MSAGCILTMPRPSKLVVVVVESCMKIGVSEDREASNDWIVESRPQRLRSALELLLLLALDLMARDVLTKLRWLRRLSMMMLCSVITLMTRDATPPMSPTTSPNRRRSARRTSERAVSLNTRRLLSTRQLRSAELLLLRTVMSRDPKF